ncbi:MAG: TlpA disulfide reductase family protein [Enhygromyxa sp.]
MLLLATGCPVAPTTAPDDAPNSTEELAEEPLIPSEPANRAAGDELEATITLAGGGALELSSLRGRPVLLEISASWEPGFAEAHELYAELLAEHPELEVIVVLAEPDDRALVGLPAGLTPAWDPAGALAAKLSVASFPTVFVLERSGRIGAVLSGWSEQVQAQLRAAVAVVNQPE